VFVLHIQPPFAHPVVRVGPQELNVDKVQRKNLFRSEVSELASPKSVLSPAGLASAGPVQERKNALVESLLNQDLWIEDVQIEYSLLPIVP
jgi:hypothetical protein